MGNSHNTKENKQTSSITKQSKQKKDSNTSNSKMSIQQQLAERRARLMDQNNTINNNTTASINSNPTITNETKMQQDTQVNDNTQTDKQTNIEQFCQMTNVDKNVATAFLVEAEWNFLFAINKYFATTQTTENQQNTSTNYQQNSEQNNATQYNTHIYETLIAMGFEHDISLTASYRSQDINKCIEFIRNNSQGSVSIAESNNSVEVNTTTQAITKKETKISTNQSRKRVLKKIDSFCDMTNASEAVAIKLLNECKWNVMCAVEKYYMSSQLQENDEKKQAHQMVPETQKPLVDKTEFITPEALILCRQMPRNDAACEIDNCKWVNYETMDPSKLDISAFKFTTGDKNHIKRCHHDLYIRINVHEQEMLRENKCTGTVRNCVYLDHLVKMMANYKDNISEITSTDVTLCLNSFVHLQSIHQTDKDFEYIYVALGGECNLKKCEKFKRNHRNRFVKDESVNCNVVTDRYEAAKMQIMDKIHCVYSHCFDVGNRLSLKEKKMLDELDEKRQYDNKNGLVNTRVLKMHKILSSKNTSYQDTREITKSKNKFLSTFDNNQQNAMGKSKTYGYGFEFVYTNRRHDYNGPIVHKKYSSMKQELTENSICRVKMVEFRSEIEKAIIHFNSGYRRYQKRMKYMLLHHILAVMIYCNFDELQSKFSRTYRKISPTETDESVLSRHSNFFWLGMYLKEACLQFGITIAEGRTKSFYHGINEEMVFPEILTANGVNIYCPLSTSASYAVSAQFAKNAGLIIEFADGTIGTSMSKEYSAKYFPCAFISDFPNEQECLFIQLKYGGLKFKNITHASYGYQFDVIFDALRIVDYLVVNHVETVNSMSRLPIAIQLIERNIFGESKCKDIKLHPYAKALIDVYFNNIRQKETISIDLQYCQKYECLTYKNFKSMFPNLQTINVHRDGRQITTKYPFHSCDTNCSLLSKLLPVAGINYRIFTNDRKDLIKLLYEMEKSDIFSVLKAIDKVTDNKTDDTDSGRSLAFASKCMQHVLSTDYDEFQQWKSVDSLPFISKKLFNLYCKAKLKVIIGLDTYCGAQYNALHIKYVSTLFPNADTITIMNKARKIYHLRKQYLDLFLDWDFYTKYKTTICELDALIKNFKQVRIKHESKNVYSCKDGNAKFIWEFYAKHFANSVNHCSMKQIEIYRGMNNVYNRGKYNLKFDLDFYKENCHQLHSFKIETIVYPILNFTALINLTKKDLNIEITKDSQIIYSQKKYKFPQDEIRVTLEWIYYLRNKWLVINDLKDLFSHSVRLVSDADDICIINNETLNLGKWNQYRTYKSILIDTIFNNESIIIHTVKIDGGWDSNDTKMLTLFNNYVSIKCVWIRSEWQIMLRNILHMLQTTPIRFEIKFYYDLKYMGIVNVKGDWRMDTEKIHRILSQFRDKYRLMGYELTTSKHYQHGVVLVISRIISTVSSKA